MSQREKERERKIAAAAAAAAAAAGVLGPEASRLGTAQHGTAQPSAPQSKGVRSERPPQVKSHHTSHCAGGEEGDGGCRSEYSKEER